MGRRKAESVYCELELWLLLSGSLQESATKRQGLAHSRTLPRVIERKNLRQVLECASPLALWVTQFIACGQINPSLTKCSLSFPLFVPES